MSEQRTCHVCAHRLPSDNAFCGACGARMPTSKSARDVDALIGQVIDSRFRMLRLIGSGGMGSVYLAEHVGIGKRVAIKVLRADLRGHPDLVGRFRREAMAVSRLTDPHTITVFDFGVWKGLVYLVMEYLRGTDLGLVLEHQGRVEPEWALGVARQLLSSLSEAHEQGVVHRDLKPENIFITRAAGGDELVKVLDFGLAKLMTETERSVDSGFKTRDGALLGTPYFMAPEQIRGGQVDGRCDLYSVGALLYLMLTGRYPYDDKSPIRILEGHLTGELPSLLEVAPTLALPAGTERLVTDLMALRPEDRPANALAVVARIQEIVKRPASLTSMPAVEPMAATAPAMPTVVPPASFPSSFSTSALLSRADWVPVESAPPGFEVATRDEFARYEQGLQRRGLWRALLIFAVLVGLPAGAWYVLYGQPAPARTAEAEPNDDSTTANRISSGVAVRGHIGARQSTDHSDRDVFVLETVPGKPARIEVSGVPRLDVIVEGYDAEGLRLFKVNEAEAGAGERYTTAVLKVPKLYISVREVWVQGQPPTENSTDAYQLKVVID